MDLMNETFFEEYIKNEVINQKTIYEIIMENINNIGESLNRNNFSLDLLDLISKIQNITTLSKSFNDFKYLSEDEYNDILFFSSDVSDLVMKKLDENENNRLHPPYKK